MNPAKRAPRRTLREFVRRLFAYRSLFVLAVMAGIAAGIAHAWNQSKAYSGFVEFAAGSTTSMSAGIRLPDAVQLRRLLLEPRVVRALMPGTADLLDVEETPGLTDLQRAIEIQPIPNPHGAERSVVRVRIEVPAVTWQAARLQMRQYVDRLQQEFESTDVVRAVRPPVKFIAVETDILPVGYIDWGDDLQERANSLGTTPANATDALRQTKAEIRTKRIVIEKAERELTSKLNQLRRIDADGPQAKIPVDVLKDSPELSEAANRYTETAVRLKALAARVTPSHPSFAAAKRQVEQAANALTQAQSKWIAKLKDEARAIDDSLANEQSKLKKIEEREAALKRLLDDKDREEKRAAKSTKQPAAKPQIDEPQKVPPNSNFPATLAKPELPIAPNRLPVAQIPAMTPKLQPVPARRLDLGRIEASNGWPTLRPGKLLVAGPFVDRQAVRPRWIHDVIYGSLIGIAFGLVLVTIRGGADQRVHAPGDIEDLNLGVDVLGSIPQLQGDWPVRVERGSSVP